MQRLSNETLERRNGEVTAPGYKRARVQPGIVHLGAGAFHRCHQAVYIDDCLSGGEIDWGIIAASLRSTETRDALTPQDGLYTLSIRSSEAERLRIIGSVQQILVAPENPGRLLAVMSDPTIRIVTLTVTEKAYLRGSDGGLDCNHTDILHDLAEPAAPRTVHGFLAEALARRRARGIAPFTVLCCDNLPANGRTLRRVLIGFAQLRDPGLADYIAGTVAFPSSMVDRIVPATMDEDRVRVSRLIGLEDAWPVMTEPYTQWVVEDTFPAGRPDWERFGVTMVKDVTPYEDMKLRLLNGSHSALAYLGLLSGHTTVDQAFADPALRRFAGGLWDEAASTLPRNAGLDPANYTSRLAERYGNTALAHQLKQIAMDGSQKLPQRIVSSALARLSAGTAIDHLALVPAAWIAACEARGRKLPAGLFPDPLDDSLSPLLSKHGPAEQTVRAVFDLAGFAHNEPMREVLAKKVAGHLARLREDGVTAAVTDLERERP